MVIPFFDLVIMGWVETIEGNPVEPREGPESELEMGGTISEDAKAELET